MNVAIATTTADRYAAWDALKLELFTPLKLRDENFLQVPTKLAVLKPEARNEIERIATGIPELHSLYLPLLPKQSSLPEADLFRRFTEDARKIVLTLENHMQHGSTRVHIGCASSEIFQRTHPDRTSILLLRALNLPTEYIAKEDMGKAPDLIIRAQSRTPEESRPAQESLRAHKIIHHIDLDTLYWFPGDLLHNSCPMPSPLPPKGVPTALFIFSYT